MFAHSLPYKLRACLALPCVSTIFLSMCGPEPAPRGLWWDVRRCPLQTETDAIQIETDAILDMADLLVTSGLAAAGYTLLAVGSCPTIQSPTIRAAIQAYIVQRGLSIVFAPHGAERQALSTLAGLSTCTYALPTSSHLSPAICQPPPPTTSFPDGAVAGALTVHGGRGRSVGAVRTRPRRSPRAGRRAQRHGGPLPRRSAVRALGARRVERPRLAAARARGTARARCRAAAGAAATRAASRLLLATLLDG